MAPCRSMSSRFSSPARSRLALRPGFRSRVCALTSATSSISACRYCGTFLPIHVRHCAREHRCGCGQGWSSSSPPGKSPDVPSLRPAHNGGSWRLGSVKVCFACKSAYCKQCFGRRSFGNVMTMQITRRFVALDTASLLGFRGDGAYGQRHRSGARTQPDPKCGEPASSRRSNISWGSNSLSASVRRYP